MGFLQVVFIAMNTVFITQSAMLSNLLTAFAISWIWSSNVKRIAIGDGVDRIFYAGGAALGSVVGSLVGHLVTGGAP
ncbi:hypothetical protein [Luteimonas saliphila]|uniref:hypothetical protein n=1 Tax=Luteimonas saliphila TaxID=2804919 RepID=UPI00192DCBDA|nr:hypothetical protein [Luteimonas saliphila]